MNILTHPWPWYVTGPLIGLIVPILLILGNKVFGISSTLNYICALVFPKSGVFMFDWKTQSWNLIFAVGIVLGGSVAGYFFQNPNPIQISESTVSDLSASGITNYSGFMPVEIFNFRSLLTLRGLILMVAGGLFVGFGSRYAGGCTSGHSIMGLSNLQWPSLVATICFFLGGTIMTWFILPWILKM